MDRFEKKTDEELVSLCRIGEKQAEDTLIRRFHPMVEKTANSLFLTGGDRDDLVQEGNVGLYQAILTFSEGKDTSFSTFAMLCIQRAAYKAIEASNRKKHKPLNLALSLDAKNGEGEDLLSITEIPAEDEVFNPERVVLSLEHKKELEKNIVGALSAFERTVLYMYLEGNTYNVIAMKLKKERKSIDNAMQRIRRKVKSLCE